MLKNVEVQFVLWKRKLKGRELKKHSKNDVGLWKLKKVKLVRDSAKIEKEQALFSTCVYPDASWTQKVKPYSMCVHEITDPEMNIWCDSNTAGILESWVLAEFLISLKEESILCEKEKKRSQICAHCD